MKISAVFLLLLLLACASTSFGDFLNDPTAVQTNNPDGTVSFVKYLNSGTVGFYNPAGTGVNILYGGSPGATWSFDVSSAPLPLSQYAYARVTFSWVGDDHSTGPAPYTASIAINGATVLNNGQIPGLVYGNPYGGPFTTWTTQSYTLSTPPGAFGVSVTNLNTLSNGFDWIAIRTIAVDLFPISQSVCSPSNPAPISGSTGAQGVLDPSNTDPAQGLCGRRGQFLPTAAWTRDKSPFSM